MEMLNNVKTGALMVALTALLVLIGHILDMQFKSHAFIYVFGAIAISMNWISYWYSDKIVLAMYKGKPVTAQEAPQLYRMVEEITQNARLPMPRVYVIPRDVPNAFATGRNPSHAAVAVTEGIVRVLSARELQAVIGHELAHVRNRDTLTQTVVASIAAIIMMIASIARFSLIFFGGGRNRNGGGDILGMLFLAIVAPLAAILIQTAISRAREYNADADGARFVRDPRALASALQKIETHVKQQPLDTTPATAHMFIINPLKGTNVMALFSTHPMTAKRVARLEAQARQMNL